MNQLAARRLREALDRVLGCAICRLQRDGTISERRTDLYNSAVISRHHPAQRRQCSMHVAEIGHFRHAAKFFRSHVDGRGHHRRHGVVDPDINEAKFGLDASCRALDRIGVSHIGNQH